MEREIRATNAKGRLSLNKSFANATVIVEYTSDTEVRFEEQFVASGRNVEGNTLVPTLRHTRRFH